MLPEPFTQISGNANVDLAGPTEAFKDVYIGPNDIFGDFLEKLFGGVLYDPQFLPLKDLKV